MNPFGNVKFVPGLGWIEQGEYTPGPEQVSRGAAALGDDSAVMMISGLGNHRRPRGLGSSPQLTPEMAREQQLINKRVDALIAAGASRDTAWSLARGEVGLMRETGSSRSASTGVGPGDVVLFGYVLPWWMWILVLGSAAYAGWLLMQKLKKGK